jgi:hypothetical protein
MSLLQCYSLFPIACEAIGQCTPPPCSNNSNSNGPLPCASTSPPQTINNRPIPSTSYSPLPPHSPPPVVQLRGRALPYVRHFCYLGSYFSAGCSLDKEISCRPASQADP